MRLAALLVVLALFLSASAMAAESAFPATAPDAIELKTLPAGVLLQARGAGNYFDRGDELFGPLFRYISRHDIAMTTPVEARIEPATMVFWVSAPQRDKVRGSEGAVEVIEVPERRVASAGGRGAYSEKNFLAVRGQLLAWLAARSDLEITGEASGVFWHGPFTPWFARRFEVHVPVRPHASE